jgi:hypothetical protein
MDPVAPSELAETNGLLLSNFQGSIPYLFAASECNSHAQVERHSERLREGPLLAFVEERFGFPTLRRRISCPYMNPLDALETARLEALDASGSHTIVEFFLFGVHYFYFPGLKIL